MRILLFILVSIFASTSYAQQLNYSVKVDAVGSPKFKYVYFYTWTSSSMQRKEFLPNGIEFNGKYDAITPDGAYQAALVIITDLDLSEKDLLKYPKENRRDFLLEQRVVIEFDAANRNFRVKGDSLNKVNNIFRDNERRFSLRLDSLTSTLQVSFPDSVTREKEYKKIRKKVFLEEKESTLKLIRDNASAGPSLQNLVIYAMVPVRPVTEVRAVFDRFPLSVRTGKKGLYVDSLIRVQENMFKGGLKIGDHMPVFSLENDKNIIVKSTSVFAKYTLIDFWASWCAPCRAEVPNLINSFETFHPKGFNIVAISIDNKKDKAKWLEAIEKDHSDKWTNLFNPGGTDNIAKELGINAIPANYLIDEKGQIIAKDLRGGALKDILEKLLK